MYYTLSGFRQHWGYVRIPDDDVISPKHILPRGDKFSYYELWLLKLAVKQNVITQKEYEDIL